MSVLESKIQVIPEKKEITVHPILQEIPIIISGIQDVDILSSDIGVTIKGSADEIKMHFSSSENRNITIPDLTESLRGFLTLEEDTAIIELRDIPMDEAMELILEYIQKYPGSRTSDILCDLGIDIEIGLKALGQLKQNELVNSEELHGSTES